MIITPSTRQKRYFAIAKKCASLSDYHRHNNSTNQIKIGCTVVKGNYVVSKGFNKMKTHTFQNLHNKRSKYQTPAPRIHAEIDALIYSRYNDLSGCEVFVYRELQDGTLGNCKPCKSCTSAMIAAGIKHIYYTTETGYHYERI